MEVTQTIGNTELWNRKKTLFLCSKHAPFGCYEAVFNWVEEFALQVNALNHDSSDCAVCFDTSELEEEVLKALLVCHVPTVLVVLDRFGDNYNVQIDRALKEDRLLIMVLKREKSDGKGLTAWMRNKYVIDNVQHIVCGPINPTGINYNLIAVTHLVGQKMLSVAEDERRSNRWSVGEVKCLLSMFYEDMGVHAIHKAIGRPYLSIYNRIKSLTMSDDLIKGREFENFLISLFDIPNNKRIRIKEWRGDKSLPGVYPENNSAPDFLFECNGQLFAVECKWRNHLPQKIDDNLLTPERQQFFIQYAKERNITVFLLLGVGGFPSDPDRLYLAKADQAITIADLLKGAVSESSFKSALLSEVDAHSKGVDFVGSDAAAEGGK